MARNTGAGEEKDSNEMRSGVVFVTVLGVVGSVDIVSFDNPVVKLKGVEGKMSTVLLTPLAASDREAAKEGCGEGNANATVSNSVVGLGGGEGLSYALLILIARAEGSSRDNVDDETIQMCSFRTHHLAKPVPHQVFPYETFLHRILVRLLQLHSS